MISTMTAVGLAPTRGSASSLTAFGHVPDAHAGLSPMTELARSQFNTAPPVAVATSVGEELS